jgi:hypothetical protein
MQGPQGIPGPSLPLNYALANRKPLSAQACAGNNVWETVPSLEPVTITTSGRPIMIHAQVRQNKTGGCAQRGHLTVKHNGTTLVDPNGYGMASSYECWAVATLNAILSVDAGTHHIELMEKGEFGGVCTYGIFDFLYVYELPN